MVTWSEIICEHRFVPLRHRIKEARSPIPKLMDWERYPTEREVDWDGKKQPFKWFRYTLTPRTRAVGPMIPKITGSWRDRVNTIMKWSEIINEVMSVPTLYHRMGALKFRTAIRDDRLDATWRHTINGRDLTGTSMSRNKTFAAFLATPRRSRSIEPVLRKPIASSRWMRIKRFTARVRALIGNRVANSKDGVEPVGVRWRRNLSWVRSCRCIRMCRRFIFH
jgi:hypothetical protein